MTRELITEERKKLYVLPIDRVRQHPDNPNNGDTDAIAESLAEFGQYTPITVQTSSYYIIKGNHTWAAAKERGDKEILAMFVDVSNDEAMRIMVGDNEIARRARPDLSQLKAILDDLHEKRQLAGTGHSSETIAELADSIRKTAHTPLDAESNVCETCGQKIRAKRDGR